MKPQGSGRRLFGSWRRRVRGRQVLGSQEVWRMRVALRMGVEAQRERQEKQQQE